MPDDPDHLATAEPKSTGGWSGTIRTVDQALVVPATVPDMVQPAGVFDADGAYIREAVLWRGRALMVPPDRPAAQDSLGGRWLWGGVLLNHFGHFLTESTGRLWGLDAVTGPLDGIVFLSKRGEADETGEVALQPYHRDFFALLGMALPIRVITKPTTVEQLVVPGQGFGIGELSAGTEAFRRYFARHFARDVTAKGEKRLYVSRSALGPLRGGVLDETRLEQFLATQGYDIFHPQNHSMQDQIARYKAADQILGLDGSAFHLVAILANPDQKVAMIRRRDSSVSDAILRHISAFSGRDPVVIDALHREWIRSDRQKPDRFSVGELDFLAVSEHLARHGFIDAASRMPRLTDDEASAAIRALEHKLKRAKMTFRPYQGADPVRRKTKADKPDRMTPRRAARFARREAEAKAAASD